MISKLALQIALFWTLISLAGAEVFAQPKPLQVGMAKSFLTDQPKSIVEIATDDFIKVMKSTTALDGQLVSKYDALEAAAKLDAKQLDFAILHAHELAWAQQKYPMLQPLLLAVDKKYGERAYVIVHKSSLAKSIADLRGKTLDMPVGTKEPCRIFLQKHCAGKDQNEWTSFFSAIEKSTSVKDALDNVARGKIQAAIVNTRSLEFYKDVRGPVFEKNLRVLQESEEFPPAVIVYRPGGLDQKILDQFRDGLLKAHTVADGQEMMKSWQFDAFERIPPDYTKRLAAMLKAYPPPR